MANMFDSRNDAVTEKGFEARAVNTPVKVHVNGFGKFCWYFTYIFIFPIFLHVKWSNDFKRMQNEINESASTVDTQLAKRAQTLLRLVEAVGSHAKFEKETYENIAKLRSLAGQAGGGNQLSADQRQDLDSASASVLGRLMVVHEAYPELKTSALVKDMMEQVTYLEAEIAAARRLYNAKVNEFNSTIFQYPKSVIADSMHLETLPLFQAKASDREDVSLKF